MKTDIKILTIVLLLISCDAIFVPKPIGFNEISVPLCTLELYDDNTKPYSFNKNNIAEVVPYVTNLIKEEEDYVKINYPSLSCSIWLTYKEIGGNLDTLNSLISNSFRLADGHNVKASGIESEVLQTKDELYATAISLEGNISSPYQIYLHDSTSNFIRLALYFDIATKNDSLAPVINYVKKDMLSIVSSVAWRNDSK